MSDLRSRIISRRESQMYTIFASSLECSLATIPRSPFGQILSVVYTNYYYVQSVLLHVASPRADMSLTALMIELMKNG